MTIGTIHGVGLGPGAADLMSVRADRLVRGARHVAYFRKSGRRGHARTIVDGMLRDDVVEYPMDYPVTTEIVFTDPRYNECLAAFYATCTAHILSLVQGGEDVVVLCEGDPFFYGSFMHLHSRLKDHAPVAVVPGITGMSGAWTASGAPITWGDDVLTVAMATLPEAELTRRIAETDALVVMKIGRHLPKLRRAIAAAGREGQAWLVEHAAQAAERVRPLVEVEDAPAPYFSIALIHGQGRRP
ncbi:MULTISPECIES: precorrin-2 C(20)-methyltransferase [Sphingomonas]|jgi:precorrin-2/cobalt-factor-2 C20-methyltransferase|uniref:Precorrin-2 C(20)-methyltransferase n=1 Tax=Sphingomonas zeae TaxID=1646122 RepID=A0A7Y6B7T3_9SPHN|nr:MULTISPECIES: precorrin-2 C(20)-methyltransferase [Sphingomonas]MBB4047149.1 precorrin-2/cobalt-factor-2 C20-methyltransferase [Sphingomonas zeae]MDK8186388.1 precorrin-2 C(20)-methyltransferase [Sphingomonas zeae]MDK8215991.1 precorrin-2 C(20)-methyltransferase [Sphingomonas sp. UMB7805-LC452B]NUU48298.1 precorrin-2 C(20)-methyltransferase [Sphingomonas zeae]